MISIFFFFFGFKLSAGKKLSCNFATYMRNSLIRNYKKLEYHLRVRPLYFFPQLFRMGLRLMWSSIFSQGYLLQIVFSQGDWEHSTHWSTRLYTWWCIHTMQWQHWAPSTRSSSGGRSTLPHSKWFVFRRFYLKYF